MYLLRLLHQKIDPNRHIPVTYWLAMISLIVLTGLVFAATTVLAFSENIVLLWSGNPFQGLIPLAILNGLAFFSLLYGIFRFTRKVIQDGEAHRLAAEEYKTQSISTQNLTDFLPIGYHSATRDGILIDINQSELDWLGYTREEVIGVLHVRELYDATFIEQADELLNRFTRDGILSNTELTMVAKDGKKIPVLINAKAIYDEAGNFSHSISAVYNFTTRKKLEAELIETHREVETAHRLNQLFMANMSHEIRTPLNAILGFANLLGQPGLEANHREYVQNIQVSGANLLAIVNDILDFEKIQSGMLRIEQVPFDLPGLLHSVITMVRPSATSKQLTLLLMADENLPAVLIGDPMRLTQILLNLLSNAIKFTHTGTVSLRVQAHADTGGQVRIRFEVMDTGIGVPESEHQRIFDRFTQSNVDTSREYGGTGLGLAVVKMLVELQHGSTQLVSTLGKGSTFIVEIPYQASPTNIVSRQEITHSQDALVDLGGNHILVVEDNPMNRRIAELFLLQLGIQVTQAEDGRVAIDLLLANPGTYQLVLMDIQMPVMDGYATTRAIRHELKLNLPIVAMTAHVLAGEREKVLACGMNDYLTKPVMQQELVAVLQRYLSVS